MLDLVVAQAGCRPARYGFAVKIGLVTSKAFFIPLISLKLVSTQSGHRLAHGNSVNTCSSY